MLTRLFISSDITKVCLSRHAQVGSRLSQAASSYRLTTVRRALHLARDVRIFTASKTTLFDLRPWACKHNVWTYAQGLARNFVSSGRSQTDTFDVNTKVINNVYLYKYDKPKFFKILNLSAVCQLVFWLVIAYVLKLDIPKRDPDKEPWKKYLNDNFILLAATTLAAALAIGSSLVLWAFTARSIRYLILNKGGESVTLVTYHPLQKTTMTVPVKQLNCKRNRKEMTNYLPLKVAGRRFFYILDKKGEFVNPTLFDHTVGAVG